MDLVDALSSNTTARSVAELSLNALFRREYSALYDGIDQFFQASSVEAAMAERREVEQRLLRLVFIASFNPEGTGTWENYEWTDPFSVGSTIDSGLHTLRVEVTDGGTYGLTADTFRIDEGPSTIIIEQESML